MTTKKRLFAAVLAVGMAFPLYACKRTGKAKEIVVKEDDPWYESTRFDPAFDIAQFQSLQGADVSYLNDKICITQSIYDNVDCFYETKLLVYDESGTLEKNIVLSGQDTEFLQSIYTVYPQKDSNIADSCGMFFDGAFTPYFLKINLDNGEIVEKTPAKDKYGSLLNQHYVTNYFQAGEFNILLDYNFEKNEYVVNIFKGTEFASVVDMSSVCTVMNAGDFVYDEKTGNISMTVWSNMGSRYMVKVDPMSGSVVESTEWNIDLIRNENISDYYQTREGELLRVDSLGNVYKLDPSTGESEKVLDNNWYSPYFSDFDAERNSRAMKVLSRTDDKIVFCFAGLDAEFNDAYTITVLKKAEKNPHAGKKVIEINAPLDGTFSDYISEAIVNFNKTDDEYLIRVWAKHNEGYKPGYEYPSNYVDPSYSLIMELKSDESPDLVMDVRKMVAMNDEILEDLSGYLDADTKAKLYENVITASQMNGKNYILPVTIAIQGIVVNESLIENGQVGFTFDQFTALSEDKLSGVSPYNYPDSIYFNRDSFVDSSIDILGMISGEKVNFDTPQFREAASYAKENFYKTKVGERSDLDGEENDRPRVDAKYAVIDSFERYESSCNNDKDTFAILGTPSVDGIGPRFTATESISVAARSDVKAGCRKFINYLYGGSFITSETPLLSTICINKEVMADQVPRIMERNAQAYQNLIDSQFLESSLIEFGLRKGHPGMIESFMDTLSNLSIYYLEEPDIINIIDEELGAYYAGDHSIEDVIRLLNDRIQTYMTETK